MDSWKLYQIKDYLRLKGGCLTGKKTELLDLAKCYAKETPEDPAIVAQWEFFRTLFYPFISYN